MKCGLSPTINNFGRIGVLAQPEYINVFVANALRFVIQNVFVNITNDFVFTLSTGGGAVGFWFNDIMTKLFATWSFLAVQLVISDKRTKYIEVPGKRYCNMIMIDSFRSLEKTHIAEYNKNSDGLEYYFIFLQIRDKLLEREMQMIFRYCFDNYWIHCNIMVQTESYCFQTQPEVINKFVDERFENDVMFPNKLRNFNKCSLKLTTWNIPPFVINGTGFQHTDHIDMISIDTYHKNQTPAIIPMSMLKHRETNITMGYFRRTALRDQLASAQLCHLLSAICSLIYLFIVLLNWLNAKNRIVQNFQIHQVFIGMPIKNLPKDSSKRIRLMVMLVTSFILRSVYQSLLFHLFRTHFYESPPVTLDGLVAQGYKADRSLPLLIIHSTNEMYPLYFLVVNQDKNFIAMSIFEFTLFYALGILSPKNALQILPINVNEQQIGFYFVKHSYLVDQFNNYILYFQQAGLLQKWKEWSNMEHLKKVLKLFFILRRRY
ncbi:uncharacterized protein LOC111674904 [Lucilia cuprina]|uniref:uncharacterized protein LOC111674904 n=1 Tax=Lucilia cuprina TaxID=7375 RepID=UPI001F069FAC|nr:uncharacterized protein LOC111674904 [Lucilia cuprina]